MRVPHVLTYKAHPVSYFIAKHLVKIKHIHLANIIMGRAIVPEFIQDDCNVETLSGALNGLLSDETVRADQARQFDALGTKLGEKDDLTPSAKAAGAVLDYLRWSAGTNLRCSGPV